MKTFFTVMLAGVLSLPALGSDNPGRYTSREVTFNNDTITFCGTLTLPEGVSNPPAAVILSGSGKQNRDGEMAGHRMFADIADYLSSRGIAVLRFDDRGTGGSGGVYEDATTLDFASDGLAAVRYLGTLDNVDTRHIGFIGHSEGGAAMSIAASQSSDVKFLVSLAGLCADGLTANIRQNIEQVRCYGLPDEDVKRYDIVNELMFRVAHKYADSDSLPDKLEEAYDRWHAMDSIYFSTLGKEFDHLRFSIYMYKMTASTPWYRFFMRYNPADYLGNVRIPVLALNGTKDTFVSAGLHLGGWKKYLPADADLTLKELPDLNHLFLPCDTGSAQEYREITAPLSEEMLSTVAEWIHSRTR